MKFLIHLAILCAPILSVAQTNRYISADTAINYNARPGSDSQTVVSIRKPATAPKSYINFKSDGTSVWKLDSTQTGSYLVKVLPRYSHPDNVPFLIGIQDNQQLPYGGSNMVFSMGWNMALGGGALIPGKPAFGISWESNYHPDNDSVTQYVEGHEFYIDTFGRQYRLSSHTLNTALGGMWNYYKTVDGIHLRSKNYPQHAPVSMNIRDDSTGDFKFAGVGISGSLVQYAITTSPGIVSVGPTAGRTSDIDFGNFNRVLIGNTGQLLYDGLEDRLKNVRVGGGLQMYQSGNRDSIAFRFDGNPPKAQVHINYNTGAFRVGTYVDYDYYNVFNGTDIIRYGPTGMVLGDLSTRPAATAAIEVKSTTKSVLLSRLTNAQEAAQTWPPGSMWYNTDLGQFRGQTATGIVTF